MPRNYKQYLLGSLIIDLNIALSASLLAAFTLIGAFTKSSLMHILSQSCAYMTAFFVIIAIVWAWVN